MHRHITHKEGTLKEDMRIELVPWSQLKPEEVKQLHQIFISEGLEIDLSSSILLRKAEGIPPIFQILVLVPFFWFSQGFFTKMGQETWDALKRGIKNAHRFLKEKYQQDPDKEMCFRQEGGRILVGLPKENDLKSLEKLAETISKKHEEAGFE